MTLATRQRRAHEFPEWPDAESRAAVDDSMAELAAAYRQFDEMVSVHSTECPGRCGGTCLEAEASEEDGL